MFENPACMHAGFSNIEDPCRNIILHGSKRTYADWHNISLLMQEMSGKIM